MKCIIKIGNLNLVNFNVDGMMAITKIELHATKKPYTFSTAQEADMFRVMLATELRLHKKDIQVYAKD